MGQRYSLWCCTLQKCNSSKLISKLLRCSVCYNERIESRKPVLLLSELAVPTHDPEILQSSRSQFPFVCV